MRFFFQVMGLLMVFSVLFLLMIPIAIVSFLAVPIILVAALIV
jgi:hypothetical protein